MRIAARPYAFPLPQAAARGTTALLCIDMQGDFLCEGGFMDALGLDWRCLAQAIPNVARLQAGFRAAGLPVLHTREGFAADLAGAQPNRFWRGPEGDHPILGDAGPLGRYLVRGAPGWQIVPELSPVPGEAVFDKGGYGSFGLSEIGAHLEQAGISSLVVCGVTAECCVHQTVQEALDRGIDCLTVSDATASAFAETHAALIRQIEWKGGVFGTLADTAAVLAAL